MQIFSEINDDENEKNIFIVLLNEVNEEISKRLENKIDSKIIKCYLEIFREKLKLKTHLIPTRSLRVLHWIMFQIKEEQRRSNNFTIEIEGYVNEIIEKFRKEQMDFYLNKEMLGKDISILFFKSWLPKMISIYQTKYFRYENKSIFWNLISFLVRGDKQNLQNECKLLCNNVNFKKRNIFIYKSITFYKISSLLCN